MNPPRPQPLPGRQKGANRREFLQSAAAAGLAATSAGLLQACAAGEAQQNKRASIGLPHENAAYARKLAEACAAAGVTGASFAYWDGHTLHTATAGLRNSVTGDPVTTDTVMHVGSVTKVLNAALMMQLVDEGKLALDEPVISYLPELRLRDMQSLRRITCAMLVNHTNGIDCDWLPEYGPDQERIVDSILRCADLGQLHRPGEATSYSNMGTVIAGYLTQKMRAESWYTLVKKRIYEPLEMQHSLVDPLEVPRFRCSVGDLTDPATGQLVQSTRPFLAPSFAPAGSTQMASAADVVTFARALIRGGVGPNGNRILSAASAALMARPTADFVPMMTSSLKVGLGWLMLPGGVLHHGGGGPGVAAQLHAHPASGRVVVLLTNCDRGRAFKPAILDPLLSAWTGLRPDPSRPRREPLDPRPFVGVYESNLQRIDVSAAPAGLILRTSMKIDVFNQSKGSSSPATTALQAMENDGFIAEAAASGRPPTEVRFVRPGRDGRMRFLATGTRLLARTT